MKDLPLSTLLPIMLETAEMSSDMDDEVESADIPPMQSPYAQSSSSPPDTRPVVNGGETSGQGGGRRGSLPCDRPASAIRRHFNQLKARRKISAPGPQYAPPPPSPLIGTPLIDLLDKLRPRQQSAATTDNTPASIASRARVHRRVSVDVSAPESSARVSIDEGFHSGGASGDDQLWKPLYVDTKLANSVTLAPATVPRQCLYYRQTSMLGGIITDQPHLHPQRQRSNSECGRYLLMRKGPDHFGASEVVGKLESEWAYCQILATMKCCDLMPPLAKMVVFDANLSIRKAFHAFVQNNVRAAPIWDNHRQLFVGLLTVTDLIWIFIEYFGDDTELSTSTTDTSASAGSIHSCHSSRLSLKTSTPTPPPVESSPKSVAAKTFDDLLNSPLHARLSLHRRDSPKHSSLATSLNHAGQHGFNHLIYALADESVSKAAKLLCDRRLHRLVILDPEKGGNPLFMLTKKHILKGLQKYIAKLPLPACMAKTLDELPIGAWSNLVTVTPTTTLHKALTLFLDKGLSALPVVNNHGHVVDMLTKVDVLNIVIENQGPVDDILKMTVQDATKNRTERSEKITTCSKKTTLLLAVECILHTDAHRLAIVDSDGKLEGILALADLMRFLSSGFVCE